MRRLAFAMIGAGLLLPGGHAHTQAPTPTLHAAMKDVVAPQTQVIWDVSNGAMDDNGNTDAARITAAQWQQVGAAALRIKDMALALAMAPQVVVVAPGAKLQDEGNPGASTPAQIQGFIDAEPAVFAEHARTLAATADGLIAAAAAKDAAKMGEIANGIDQVCEECHQRFWYPQEKAAE